MQLRALVLNSDYSFLNITRDWFSSVILVGKGSTYPLATYDKIVRSESAEFQVPAVVIRRDFVDTRRKRHGFQLSSHKNIWVREKGRCAYCDRPISLRATTREHVIPSSKGGSDRLDNVVAACQACNSRKADRMPAEAGMKLRDDVELRQLTNAEKLSVILKTHESVERRVWLEFLKKNDLSLF